MKKILWACLTALLFLGGCQINNVKNEDLDIAILPSATSIQLQESSVSDFYYDFELKKDADVELKKITIEYFDESGKAVSALESVQDNISTIKMTTKGDKQSLKGITYVPQNVRDYMSSKSLKALYAKVHFYFTVNDAKEVEKIPPLVEISTTIVSGNFEIAGMAAYDTNSDGMFDNIKITLNKEVDRSTVKYAGTGFKIENGEYTISSASASGKTIDLTINKSTAGYDTAETPKVQYSKALGGIKDINGNELFSVTYDDVNVEDRAGPVLEEVVINSTTSVALTFSERIASIEPSAMKSSVELFSSTGSAGVQMKIGSIGVISGKTVTLSLTDSINKADYKYCKIVSTLYIKDINNNFVETGDFVAVQ